MESSTLTKRSRLSWVIMLAARLRLHVCLFDGRWEPGVLAMRRFFANLRLLDVDAMKEAKGVRRCYILYVSGKRG